MSSAVGGTNSSAWHSQSSKDSGQAQHLIDRYENGHAYPNDSTNARALVDWQANGMRGMPQDAVAFDTQQTVESQKIDALPQKDRDRFSGMLAEGINVYESMTSASDRQKVAQAMVENVDKALDAQYGKIMADPAQRIRLEFRRPFGAQFLGSAGEQQSALLERLGSEFDHAKTPAERESLFSQAAGIRHDMQLQIQSRIGQGNRQTDQQWEEADKAIYAAQDNARGMQIATQGDFDNVSPFERLTLFGRQAFTSQRNAQAFQYLSQQHPERFKDLKSWYDDASAKTESARSAIQSDPFRRLPNLPPALADFANAKSDDLHVGNYGRELLDGYQQMTQGVIDDEKMYHAASQRGPIRNEYLDAHTPPKPLWQQQTEDVLGRFFVGMIPGVNLLTNLIVPAKSLSTDAKDGIDFLSGVLGGMLGEAKIPGGVLSRESEAGERGGRQSSKVDAEHTEGGEAGKGASGKRGETNGEGEPRGSDVATGGASGNGADAPVAKNASSSIPDVPETYVSKSAGALTPDSQFRGIYRDSKGGAYIQQDGQTFAVSYKKDNGTWAVNSPHKSTAPPYPVRLDSNGKWEMNPDTGLAGGGRRYTDANGRAVYELYSSGESYPEISRQLNINKSTPIAWAARYAREHDLPAPYSVEVFWERNWMKPQTGQRIYEHLSNGVPLTDVADKCTLNNTFAAYRSAMRYARNSGLSDKPVLDARVSELGAEAKTPPEPRKEQSINVAPRVEPMTRQQYAQAQQLYDAGQLSPKQIADQTGVPEPWVKDVEHGYGYWSPSKQAYIEPIRDPASPAEPPAKKQRVEGPAGTSADPTSAGPGWGRNEVRLYIEDMQQLDDTTSDDIDRWLNHNGPAPAGLQQEMVDQGYPNLTPDEVRAYLDANSPVDLTTQQRIMISRWLDL